jgi:hypothetical protein
MKRLKKILLVIIMFIPFVVNADSGLDSNYAKTSSLGEALVSVGSSLFSFFGELLKNNPGDKDYNSSHLIISIICIIVFYICTNMCVFKLDITRNKSKKRILILLLISLIPTILFSLLCFLTSTYLILYIFALALYIILFNIITSIILKIRLSLKIKKVKEIDKDFNKKEISKELFDSYKNIQLAWMDSTLTILKDLVSKEIYNDYKVKLEELNKNNQKNIMSSIELKSNKITNIQICDNIETIECEMNVICYDYIVDNEDKVVKGKNDKKYNYLYRLTFERNIKNNKYILIEKKLLKTKI